MEKSYYLIINSSEETCSKFYRNKIIYSFLKIIISKIFVATTCRSISRSQKMTQIYLQQFVVMQQRSKENVDVQMNLNFIFADYTQITTYSDGFDRNVTDLVPQGLNITNREELLGLAKLIKQFYLPKGHFSKNKRSLIKVLYEICFKMLFYTLSSQYFSDQGFARSIIKHAQLQSEYSPVYFYEFAFHGVLGGYVTKSGK